MISKGLDFQSRVWKVNIQGCGAKFPNGPLGFIKLCFAEGLGFWASVCLKTMGCTAGGEESVSSSPSSA
jgi:hypothetical protein